MAIPSTGTTWKAGGFNEVDATFLERGGKIALLVRQARGAATDLSPHNSNGTTKWSPFALDGTLRDDLFAIRKVGGFWTTVQEDNEGFYLVGAFKEGDGPTVKSKIDDDDFMIEQSNFPYDSDRVKEEQPFSFTPVDTLKPVLRRIRNGLPLVDDNGDNLVELPGQPNTVFVLPVEYTPINYQFLIIREFNKPSGKIQTVKAFDLVKINDIGDSKMGKKDSEAAELTGKPLPSGFFMGEQDGEYQPIIKAEWIGGPGYAALYGSPVSQYTVTLGSPSAGNFTLGLDSAADSGSIAYNIGSAASLKTALVAIDDGYTASDWTVTGSSGGPYTVTTPGGRVLLGSGAGLTGGSFSIAPVTP